MTLRSTSAEVSIEADQEGIRGQALIPALAARYRDLSALRYDFPVVLLNGAAGGGGIRPLAVIVDDLLRVMPAGDDAARVALHVLDLERHIRAAVARGERGLLSVLWDRTAARVAGHSDLRQDSVARARAALTVDGEVADCDAALPARVLQHYWQTRQAEKGRQFLAHAGRLVLQLSEILRAEFGLSASGRTSEALRASIGGPLEQAFDFEAMARVLASSTPACTIDDARRRRLHGLMSTLSAQRFYPAAGQIGLGFSFDSCVAALRAYRERLPLVLDLVSALGAAELEAAGEYTAARHDAFFDELRAGRVPLVPRDLSLFPDYFVHLKAAAIDPIELDALLDVVATACRSKCSSRWTSCSRPQSRATRPAVRCARDTSRGSRRVWAAHLSCKRPARCSRRRKTRSSAGSPSPGRRCSRSIPAPRRR